MGLIDCFICLSFVCLYLSLFALRRRLPYSSFLFAGTFVLFEPIPKAVSLDNQMFKSDPGGALKEFSNRIVCGRSARKSFIDTQRIELIRENNISHGGGSSKNGLQDGKGGNGNGMNNSLKSGNGMNSPMGGKRLTVLRSNISSSSKKGGGMGGKKGGGMGAIGEEDRDPRSPSSPSSPRMPGT
jgi:hypothetical protein